jgi:hypothetical protein
MKRDPLPQAQRPLAAQSISADVLKEKYFKPGEHSAEQLYGASPARWPAWKSPSCAPNGKPFLPTCTPAPSAPGAS